MSAGYAPGSIRVWDGTTWLYQDSDWVEPTYEIIKAGGVSALIATTTSVSKTGGAIIHYGTAITITGSTTGRNGGTLQFYKRIGSGAWTLLASRAAPTGGGSVSVTHTPTAGTTSYYVKFTGSSTHKGSSSSPTSGVLVQTKKTATKTVGLSWAQAYNGSGKKISGSGRDGAVHQGYYSGTHGNRKSLLRFNPALPAGATVSKVIFDCNSGWSHWYNNSGGTIVVGWFGNQNTEPSTWGGADVHPNKTRKAVDTGSWEVDITSWADTAVVSSSWSGITIGPGPTTSREYYGYSVAAPVGNFALRITYSYWG